jgi:hypothetical protein
MCISPADRGRNRVESKLRQRCGAAARVIQKHLRVGRGVDPPLARAFSFSRVKYSVNHATWSISATWIAVGSPGMRHVNDSRVRRSRRPSAERLSFGGILALTWG